MPRRKAPPNAYWRGDVLWGRLKVAGDDIRWSLRTDDPRLAAKRIDARQKRERARAFFGDQRRTWDEAVTAWAQDAIGQIGPTTAKRYGVSLRQCEPYLRGRFLDEIDRASLTDMARERRKQGITVATVRRDLSAVSRVLDHAEAAGWRPDNPALFVLKRFRERRDPIVLPPAADIEAVLAVMPDRLAALTRAAWLTGMRQNELATLRHSQVDHARRQVTLYRTKNGKPRALELSPAAYELIRSQPHALGCEWVFWHGPGEPYRGVSGQFRRCLAVAQKRAQRKGGAIPSFRFHDLRHVFAVDYLKAGGSIYDLKENLGHSSIAVTEMYLAYLTPEEARVAKQGAQKGAQAQRLHG